MKEFNRIISILFFVLSIISPLNVICDERSDKVKELEIRRNINKADLSNLKVVDFAWLNKCDSLELVARPGWKKVLKPFGYIESLTYNVPDEAVWETGKNFMRPKLMRPRSGEICFGCCLTGKFSLFGRCCLTGNFSFFAAQRRKCFWCAV